MEYADLIGKTVEEARTLRPGYRIRVGRIDGEPCICTRDYRLDRINVHLENNVIVKVTGVG